MTDDRIADLNVEQMRDALERIRTEFTHDDTINGDHIFEGRKVAIRDECPVCIAREGLGLGVR